MTITPITPIMTIPTLQIDANAPIATWFKVGGHADRLARPVDIDQVRQCLELDPALRVLGDGANLLVDDDGVGELVVSLDRLNRVDWDLGEDLVEVGAGVNLPKFITEAVRRGRAGVEGLGGIPATMGGALVMNAGGAFGQIADVVERVTALTRQGELVVLPRASIAFGYRHSGLNGLIIVGATLRLPKGDTEALRARLKEVMAYKRDSQPMADNSAGCCFKNPTLEHDVAGAGVKGQRVSAGKLIDMAGCKGLRIGSASVSERHGNFLTADTGGKARDVILLMEEVERRVRERFGVTLHREVAVWRRTPAH
ncbi:MAG: UDP-N-acetylenolpyruvoylglucosamine reductase [Planctomycetota bacterium]|jgi:UDP-N-acetylmuramate dehydrogenase